MLKLTLRDLISHKFRFLLTAFSVVLGVSFVVGSFVIADSLQRSFVDLFNQSTSGLDLYVRSTAYFENTANQRAPIPEGLVDEILGVPGVSRAEGDVAGYAQVVNEEGKAATSQGAPMIGLSWGNTNELNALKLFRGKKPAGHDQVAIDIDTADQLNIEIDDRVTVMREGPSLIMTVVGIFSFGEKNQLAGARLTAFDLETAQDVMGKTETYDGISIVTADDSDLKKVEAELNSILDDTIEVVERQVIVDENLKAFSGFIKIFGRALLGFAGVAMFVSAFVIANTFNIIVGQRTRELALLRAIGATPAQVRALMSVEALIVGIVGTTLGLAIGLLPAEVIQGIFNAAGAGLPDSETVFAPRTVLVAIVVGIGVTLGASLLPSRKASLISPVAGLNAGLSTAGDNLQTRLILATGFTLFGALALLYGLFISDETTATLVSLAIGSMTFFIGVAALGVFFARPIAQSLGFFYPKAFGMVGLLARENASRNPARTASAASALMVGLALVSMVLVIGNSVKDTVVSTMRGSTQADFIIQSDSFTPFSTELAKELSRLPEIEVVGRVRIGQIQILGDTKQLTATDPEVLASLVDPEMVSGAGKDLAGNTIFVHKDPAKDLGLAVGDNVEVTFPATGNRRLQVAGIYNDATIVGNWVIGMQTYEASTYDQFDLIVMAKASDGVKAENARGAVEAVTKKFPQTTLRNQQEFQDNQVSQINSLLMIVNVLLGLAIIIAMLGILNTMALSIFERTREIGLLRSVGMTRRQVQRMVRLEAVLISIFGGLAGTTIGVLFGLLLGSALPESLIDTVSIPTGQVISIVFVAALFGLFAGYFPARRATKLDVLDALSQQ